MRFVYNLIQRCCGHDSPKLNDYDITSEKIVFEAESLKDKTKDEGKSHDHDCIQEIAYLDAAEESHPMSHRSIDKKSEEIKSTKDNLMQLVEKEFPDRIVKKKARSVIQTLEVIPKITLTGPDADSSTKTLFKEEPKKKGKRGKGKKKEKSHKKKPGLA
jgi:hypothetical protein